VPWILLLLATLYRPAFGRDAARRSGRHSEQPASSEPDRAEKAAYGALADVLENDAARQELIDQLRKAAATPPPDSTKLTPPEIKDEPRCWRTSPRSAANTVNALFALFPAVAQYHRLSA
jgi:hypothetical protein